LTQDLAPVRIIKDRYSRFDGMAVDPLNNEIVVSDSAKFNLLVYDSTRDGMVEPRRVIGGPKTKVQYVCGVEIDPVSGEIYTVNNDTFDNMLVFSRDQYGNVGASRELHVGHGAWGISLDRDHDELAISVQHTNRIEIYRRAAEGEEKPVRLIQGPNTGLADPHGVYIDGRNGEIFVANHGSWHKVESGETLRSREAAEIPSFPPSTGKFLPPSITVYSRTADGDRRPIRTIQGPRTRLEWPLGIYVDTERDEIFAANGGDSILVFSRTGDGDVEPLRVIEGPETGLKSPTAVYMDTKRDEIWASNWDGHSATVYSRTAKGNVRPLRTIRSAPPNTPGPGFGNPGGVAYDPMREQIIVPN
jgi:DNA-binding beta-propeller fold protein YncE